MTVCFQAGLYDSVLVPLHGQCLAVDGGEEL
jgi:hypothetical protein